MRVFPTLSKIDKNCFFSYVQSVAYPKQQPDKVSKSAGISLPTDMIDSLTRAGEKRGKTKSALAREILKAWLQKSGDSLEAASKPKLAKAKSSVKKRR